MGWRYEKVMVRLSVAFIWGWNNMGECVNITGYCFQVDDYVNCVRIIYLFVVVMHYE